MADTHLPIPRGYTLRNRRALSWRKCHAGKRHALIVAHSLGEASPAQEKMLEFLTAKWRRRHPPYGPGLAFRIKKQYLRERALLRRISIWLRK